MATQQNEPVVIGTVGSQINLTKDEASILAQLKSVATGWYPDDEGSANTAVSAAVRYLKTDRSARNATIQSVADDIAEARGASAFALAEARGTVVVAVADGWSENALAQALGVDRMTIRKWRGKRD
jgi:Homeodomain-like domain